MGTVFLLWFSRVNYILRRVRGGEGGRRRGALQESTARLINADALSFFEIGAFLKARHCNDVLPMRGFNAL